MTEVLPAHYSNVPAAAIGDVVARDYDLGELDWVRFVSRGNNDVYGLRTSDGRRYIARLNHRRVRGPSDTAFETDLLAHLRAVGAPVVAAVPARDGSLWRMLRAAEGEREFAVFEFLAGQPPRMEPDDYRLFGETLGRVHAAARGFTGAGSRYSHDLQRILYGAAERLAAVPYFNGELRGAIAECAAAAEARLAPLLGGLSWQVGHGDAAPVNSHIAAGSIGERSAGFIDFEEAGPTWRSYEISHVLFHLTRSSEPGIYSDDQRRLWDAFLEGLARTAPLSDADLAAVIAFIPVRWIGWGTFFADRLDEWGSSNLQAPWLAGQMAKTRRWLEADAP